MSAPLAATTNSSAGARLLSYDGRSRCPLGQIRMRPRPHKGNHMARTRRKNGRNAASGAQARLLGTLHQVYLAGLGALSRASNGAPQLFEQLVAEGARVHADTRGAAEK